MTEHLAGRDLGEEGLVLACSVRQGQSIMDEKTQWQEHEAGVTLTAVSRQEGQAVTRKA